MAPCAQAHMKIGRAAFQKRIWNRPGQSGLVVWQEQTPALEPSRTSMRLGQTSSPHVPSSMIRRRCAWGGGKSRKWPSRRAESSPEAFQRVGQAPPTRPVSPRISPTSSLKEPSMSKEQGRTVVNSCNEWGPLKHVIVGRAMGTTVQAPERATEGDWRKYGIPLGTYGIEVGRPTPLNFCQPVQTTDSALRRRTGCVVQHAQSPAWRRFHSAWCSRCSTALGFHQSCKFKSDSTEGYLTPKDSR